MPTDAVSMSSSAASSQVQYPESHESQDSTINRTGWATNTEMGRIINFMNLHSETRISR